MGIIGKDHKRKALLSKVKLFDVIFWVVVLAIIIAFYLALSFIPGCE